MPVMIDRIIRSKRRTIALIMEGDGSVTVRAPMRASNRLILQFVEKRARLGAFLRQNGLPGSGTGRVGP